MRYRISSYSSPFHCCPFSTMSRTRSSHDQDKITVTSCPQCGGSTERTPVFYLSQLNYWLYKPLSGYPLPNVEKKTMS